MSQSPAGKKKGESAGGRTFYPEWLVEALEMQGDDVSALPQSPGAPASAASGRNGEARAGGAEGRAETDRTPPDPGAADRRPDRSSTGRSEPDAARPHAAGSESDPADDLGLDEPAEWLKFDWADPQPEEPGADVNGAEPPRRRHLYLGFESTRVPPRNFRCRVMIQLDGHDYVGEATGPEIPGVRAEITARATLDALLKAEGNRIELALLGARVLRVFDRPVAIVSVYGLDDDVRPLIGACMIRESIEQATALATLQATNRWVSWEMSKQGGS